MARPKFRSHLMDATRCVHERLHAERRFAALQAGNIDNADYDDLMAAMGGFYTAFDTYLLAASDRLIATSHDYVYRPRAHLFPRVAAIECNLPYLATPAALAGAVYVVDGAVLGGQMLGRLIQPYQRHPYWDWCASTGAVVWHAARALMSRVDTDAEARHRGAEAAFGVFTAFEAAMMPDKAIA